MSAPFGFFSSVKRLITHVLKKHEYRKFSNTLLNKNIRVNQNKLYTDID